MSTETEIDDSLYSRQRYVLGDSAMQRMARSSVLLCGLGGLGVEIAKNIILAGVKSVTLQDSQPASFMDLGSQFYLTENDVKQGKNRVEACRDKLAELNPYVSVQVKTEPLTAESSIDFLAEYQCVVLTEASLDVQLRVNQFCRSQNPQIKFISADVYGVFCWTFADFGDSFEVFDANGEEPKELFISSVTKDNPGVVTTLDNRMHGLETDDVVAFKEIQGMTEINEKEFKIKVHSPYQFSIGDTSGATFSAYESGGIVMQIKKSVTMTFKSLEEQLKSPDIQVPDLCKFDTPMNIHIGMQALHEFSKQHSRLPNVRCAKDADILLSIAKQLNTQLSSPMDEVKTDVITRLSMTSQGCFAPLCAYLGGAVAQEALKAVTGKFSPLKQWLHLDATEVLAGLDNCTADNFMPRQDRYDSLRICIGQPICEQLAKLKLFMVGCGAIGCEMLKNYAMLGVASHVEGNITITDNDLIEKSNLNRQFLFRPQHIRKPKSTTAAQSTIDINPQLKITPQQHKVCPQTEASVYHDDFFTSQHVVVNALDNLEARRYMDSRCVTNQRPLLESGTMGAKGHVQVIVPHLTESYSSQRDPVDEDVPFCTLKSFPAQIEHCIQWARDKFESSFTIKPAHYSKFWATNSDAQQVIESLSESAHIDGCVQVSKMCASRPHTIQECIALARCKFEKYFNHKAKQLIYKFPLDTKLSNGALFWQSPKRPPTPVDFNTDTEEHMNFVRACARLYADANGVSYTSGDLTDSVLKQALSQVSVPQFMPSSKKIETDESVKKEAASQEEELQADDLQQSATRIQRAIHRHSKEAVLQAMRPLCFEKDDDSNGHVDFITAASNLRAAMYSLEAADRLKTKRIAGRIVPAIATTTAAVAGLVAIELIKVVKRCALEEYRNAFLNLALPLFVLSEPGAVQKTTMQSIGLAYSIWDRWDVRGHKDMTLAQFMQELKRLHNVEPNMVVQGNKLVYMPIMPPHKKRLPQTMVKLLKPGEGKQYADLVVSFTREGDDDEMGPPVRYFFYAN